MIFMDGIAKCECGERAVFSSAIGWKCPTHGVQGLTTTKTGE